MCLAGVQTENPADRRPDSQNSGVHGDRVLVHPGIVHVGRSLVAGQRVLFAAHSRRSTSQTGKPRDHSAMVCRSG